MKPIKVIYSKFCSKCGQMFKSVQPLRKKCIKCTKAGLISQDDIRDIGGYGEGKHTYVRFNNGGSVCSCGILGGSS